MANFKVDSATQTTYNAGSEFRSMINQAESHREGNTSFEEIWTKSFSGSQEYSVVGINTQQIPYMKSAIDDYIRHLMYITGWLEHDIYASEAFKGENIPGSVYEYFSNVMFVCDCIVSYLRVFQTKLDNISQAWQQSAINMQQRVENTTSTMDNVKFEQSR